MTSRLRVLLTRPDHLLLTLPAAAALRTALPQAHLAYAVPPAVAAAAAAPETAPTWTPYTGCPSPA